MSQIAAPRHGARPWGLSLLFALLCLFASAITTAQTALRSSLVANGATPPQPLSLPTPPAAGSQQRPTFGAVVSRVRVDVIVTDKNERFIDDLRPEDFLVYEDGEIQEVLTVQLVNEGTRTVVDLSTALATEPASQGIGTVGEGTPPDGPDPGDLGAMVFLIDGFSLDPEARSRFARAWRDILDATGGFSVPRAAYMIDAGGDVQELAALTYEVDELGPVADAVRSVPSFGTSMESRLLQLLSDMEGVAFGESGGAHMIARGYENEELRRSLSTLELLTQFCNSLVARSGRTALVWVSSGVKLTEGGPFWALAGNDPFQNTAPHAGILKAQTALHEAANSANVSIYAVDPTSLSDQHAMGLGAAAPGSGVALQSDEVRWALSGMSDSLHNAASATGGQAYVMWSDLGRALREIENDGRQYYLLTYAAPAPLGDREYHEIRVEVGRSDLNVRARQGYLDLPEEERGERTIVAALALPGMSTGMDVRAEAVRRWSESGAQIVQMLASIDTPPRAEEARLEVPLLEILAAAVTADGGIAAEVHETVLPLAADVAGPASPPVAPFVYVHDWTIEPGKYELRVAVRDTISGKIGAASVAVEVPQPEDGWKSSDLVLTAVVDEGESHPVVGGRVWDGDTVSVYAEVANGVAPFISGMILDAEVPDSRPALLPAYHLQRDMAGIHRGSIAFRGLPPGAYTLEISVTDAHADRQENYSYPLEVLQQVNSIGVATESALPPLEPLDLSDPADPEALSHLLERLTRVAWLYMDQALSFVADESIESMTYDLRRSPPRRVRDYQFEYVYGLIDEDAANRFSGALPGKYTDYRRRKGARGDDRLPGEVVASLRLPMLISKAYSFPLIFREALWPLHSFEISGEETVLERPAVGVRIIPKPPIQQHINDWFGTAWFDRESLQPLKFEVYKEEEFLVFSEYEAAMRGEIPADDFTFTRTTALFGTEKNGMRFPSKIVIERSRYDVKGPPGEREAKDRVEFRVTQRYSNYRFFNVRTEEEVREMVFGRTQREGGR